MWTHNRVKEILTAIKWVVGGVTTYPIYHIESSMNIADIVTKPRQLYMADIDRNSLWQTGMQWMQLPSDLLPKTQVRVPTGEKEQHDFESELFPEIYAGKSRGPTAVPGHGKPNRTGRMLGPKPQWEGTTGFRRG
jgi:hypothetical protein